MSRSIAAVLLAAALIAALALSSCPADALKLPSYITACRKDDPQLNACAVKNGKAAIPVFINGDRKYKIPVLNPLTIYNFTLNEGTNAVGLKIHLKEANIHGLAEADFRAARIDLKKMVVDFDFHFSRIMILGNYNVSGRVLVLPISGNGDANITLTDLDLTYSFNFKLETRKKDGKEYISLQDSKVTFTAKHAYFYLSNLFNGDKRLGETMNIFLNENWEEVVRELGPSVADAIGEVIKQIIAQITDLVPYENIFM